MTSEEPRSQPTDEGGNGSAEIYQQDCEFYRHQDRLMWGRFQTAATVEAALLYAIFGLEAGELNKWVFLLSGSVLVLVLCLLSLKDRSDAKRHLARIRGFEKDHPLQAGTWPAWPGVDLMTVGIVIINAVNLYLVFSACIRRGFVA